MAITIDGDSGVSGVNGSATTPALQGTDSNTGIVFGTDTVQVATGGSTRATVDSSGRVLIGHSSNYADAGADDVVIGSFDHSEQGITIGASSSSQIRFADAGANTAGYILYNHGDDALAFSANGSQRMRVDSSGRLLVGGHSSAREHLNDGSDSAQIILEGTTQNTSTLAVIRNSNNDGPAHLVLGKSRGTNANSPTVVQSGDTIGHINFEGADGTHLIRAAQISCVVDGGPGADDMPGRLKFSTCPNGSNGLVRRMEISNQGRLDVFASNLTDAHFISSAASAGTAIEFIKCMHSASSIGSGTTSFKISTNGNVQNTNNSYGSISDVKLKENIADASSQWDDIKAVQIRNYNFKEDTGHPTHTQIGVVAQEIETVSPGLVYETPDSETVQVPVLDENGEAVLDENGEARFTTEDRDLGTVTKSVNYSVLYMKAVKALQEAQTRIETLETQYADLLARVTALEAA